MHVWLSEKEEEITDDGSVLQIIIKKKLRECYNDVG
jgi:hypothetical protein